MELLIAQILAAALGLLQQGVSLQQRKANGEEITEADLQAERDKTQQLLAEGDLLRSKPRGG